jgi:hypothetical protein
MRLFWEAKKRARRRGVAFSITPDDVTVPTSCPLLGLALAAGAGRQTAASPALDRRDPSRGYEPGNAWVISYRANTLKSDATLEELERLCRALRRAGGR